MRFCIPRNNANKLRTILYVAFLSMGIVGGSWPANCADVKTPNLKGLTVANAIAELDNLNLLYNLTTIDVCGLADRVADQQPSHDTVVQTGAHILLWIARGNKRVPNVVGLTLADAEILLNQQGLVALPREQRKEIGDLSCPGNHLSDYGVAPDIVKSDPAADEICLSNEVALYRLHTFNVGSSRNPSGICP